MVEYRVEKKYLVSDLDLAVLSQRLGAVMERDSHQAGDCYAIRSLYFDDVRDSCMEENDAGVDQRNKYRIRTYNTHFSFLRLEIKEKVSGLTRKSTCSLSPETYRQMTECPGQVSFGPQKVLNRFVLQMRCRLLRPKAIIWYERTAFVHASGNVRITFDRNIAASPFCEDFLKEQIPDLVPVLPAGMHILEVKYDDFLPDAIARQLEIGRLQQTAFSKYYLGRLAIQGEFPIGP